MPTTTNGRRITTHEATITTAAIAIKTLTISYAELKALDQLFIAV